jgi:hypothetical protein
MGEERDFAILHDVVSYPTHRLRLIKVERAEDQTSSISNEFIFL